MKNKIKLFLAVATIGFASVSSAALLPSSGKVTISSTGFDGGIYGGEFEAQVLPVSDFDAFYTFCLEKNESLKLPSGTYDYTITDSTDLGVPTPYATGNQGGKISKGTAYLFEEFVHGSLYPRTLDAAHSLAAGQLQAAIWFLEGENKGNSALVPGNPFLALVAGIFLGSETDDYDGSKVKVMNLTTTDDNGGVSYWQDQLVYVPDSGATLALLGLALTGLVVARRRIA